MRIENLARWRRVFVSWLSAGEGEGTQLQDQEWSQADVAGALMSNSIRISGLARGEKRGFAYAVLWMKLFPGNNFIRRVSRRIAEDGQTPRSKNFNAGCSLARGPLMSTTVTTASVTPFAR